MKIKHLLIIALCVILGIVFTSTIQQVEEMLYLCILPAVVFGILFLISKRYGYYQLTDNPDYNARYRFPKFTTASLIAGCVLGLLSILFIDFTSQHPFTFETNMGKCLGFLFLCSTIFFAGTYSSMFTFWISVAGMLSILLLHATQETIAFTLLTMVAVIGIGSIARGVISSMPKNELARQAKTD